MCFNAQKNTQAPMFGRTSLSPTDTHRNIHPVSAGGEIGGPRGEIGGTRGEIGGTPWCQCLIRVALALSELCCLHTIHRLTLVPSVLDLVIMVPIKSYGVSLGDLCL